MAYQPQFPRRDRELVGERQGIAELNLPARTHNGTLLDGVGLSGGCQARHDNCSFMRHASHGCRLFRSPPRAITIEVSELVTHSNIFGHNFLRARHPRPCKDSPAMLASSPSRTYRLRSRLLLVIVLSFALAVTSGACTVFTALTSHRAIVEAHDLQVASRRAALLSVIVREQYIHEAHTIILRDRSHVDHHNDWVLKLNAELDELRPDVDAAGSARLIAVGEASRNLVEVFSTAILPAIDRKDWAEVHRAHEQANALVDQMTEHADALARYFDARAMEAERAAVRFIQIAFAISIGIALIAATLALGAGRNLWRAFSTPLASLERVAQRVATGDRRARVEAVAAAELAVVADAFNHMLDALAHAEAEVVASERLAAIGRIAAGVAHEINNPIAVIRGYVKTMRQEAQQDDLREELRILDEEATACQRIAEELLMYARSPALELRSVDAPELLRDASERGASGVVVDAEPAIIFVDPLRIRQVIVNLVTNARDATAGDEVVIVRGHRHGDGYRIEVLDRGTGIAAETGERLFEPFFTTRRDGTGLGLAVCYGLVSAHGGTIRAEPRSGGGSCFVVDLPSVVVDDETRSSERT
jgi:two-component system, NtrC family, sensor kinase